MERYLGVKIIHAEPMSEFDFRRAKGMTPSSDEKDKNGYKVIYEDGYVSWSPKDVFEKAYRRIDGLTFGLAIEALKQGKKVARKGWNGKGMWLHIANGKHYDSYSIDLFSTDYPQTKEVLPTIIMKTATDEILVGWLASQTDMLAEDWMIVE